MLRSLRIRNLAIIDELELEFRDGFTVLSGETGAGKSILIDALGLVLGDRADAALVRSGQNQAEISAEFSLDASLAARAWLRDQAMDDADNQDHCILRRVIGADGRSRAFINGTAAPLASLRELGEQLVQIHGQNEHQGLLRSDIQLDLLDDFGGHGPLLAIVLEAVRQHDQTVGAIEKLRAVSGRDPAQLEYLQFQLRELDTLALRDGEIGQLDEDHRRLANAGRLLEDGQRTRELLYGGDSSLHDQISAAANVLSGLAEFDPAFGDAAALLLPAGVQIQEAADLLARSLDRLDLDPQRLAEIERRLEVVHDMARKHRVKPSGLPGRQQALHEDLAAVEGAAGELSRLEAARELALKAYRTAADRLSVARSKAARQLGTRTQALVRELGMPKCTFTVEVQGLAAERPRRTGDDEVRFDFTANPGQAARPLAKVASGGELSRIALALQIAVQQGRAPATLIFDEVDAGVGGSTAETVGKTLRELATRRQVLCVTHLAQVAAQGENHFAIHKEVRGSQTLTRVSPLNDGQRVSELARMLGGRESTAAAHAQDLLKRASDAT